MFKKMLRYNTDMKILRFTADSGYESEENYTFLKGMGIDCYIKPQTYERKRQIKPRLGIDVALFDAYV